MKIKPSPFLLLAFISATTLQQVHAGTTWDGTGTPNTDINNAANWDSDTLPDLTGLASVTFGSANSTATVNTDVEFTKATFSSSFTIASGAGNFVLRGSTSGSTPNLQSNSGAINVQINEQLLIESFSPTSGSQGTLLSINNNRNVADTTALNINNGVALAAGSTATSYDIRYANGSGGLGDTRIAGTISGLGTLANAGTAWAGDLIIAGNQSLSTSNIAISSGVGFGNPTSAARLILGESSSESQIWNNITLNNTMTLAVGGAITAGTLSIGGTATNTNTKIVGYSLSNSTLSLAGGNATANVTLGGAGTNENNLAIVHRGNATTSISNASNTYAGGTVAEASGGSNALTLGANGAFGTGGLTIGNASTGAGNTAKVQLNGFNQTVTFLTSGSVGTRTLENGSATLNSTLTVNQSTDTSFSGLIQNGAAGTLKLVKSGGGSLTVSNTTANTFTGGLQIDDGTLAFSAANQLGNSGTTAPNLNGGTLKYTAATLSTDNVGLNVTAASSLEVSNSTSTLRLGGTLSGSGQLTINGPGVVALGRNAVNTTYGNGFTGDIVVSNGATLSLRNPNSMGSTAGGVAAGTTTIQDGGTLLLDPFSQTSVIFNSESLVFRGASTLTNRLNGQASLTNTITGPISTAGTLTVNTRDDAANSNPISLELSGAITGNGGVNFGTTGGRAGTYIVSNNSNAYLGATNVNSGTLAIHGNQEASNGNVTVSNTGTRLVGTGTIGGDTTIDSGAIHSAGGIVANVDKVGIQTFDKTGAATTNLSYGAGSIFEWDLASGTLGTRGTDYDGVNVTGTLGGSGAVFRVVLGTGSFSDTFWNTTREWSGIFTASNAFDMSSIFSSIQWWEGTTNVTGGMATPPGHFSFTATGTTLTWSAVPEPSSALAALVLGAGLLRRRRRA